MKESSRSLIVPSIFVNKLDKSLEGKNKKIKNYGSIWGWLARELASYYCLVILSFMIFINQNAKDK